VPEPLDRMDYSKYLRHHSRYFVFFVKKRQKECDMILVCQNVPKQLSHLSGIVSSEFRPLRIRILLFILILSIYICTIHYFLILVEYTRNVRANYLVSLTTLATCISARTHSTVAVYAAESDVGEEDEKRSDSVRNLPSQHLEKSAEGAYSTLEAEISELDNMGFDETLLGNDDENA
jgi:hypothetical protein